MSSTKLKPLYLIDLFTRETDEEHRFTASELAQMLSETGVPAERKGVYRDIEALTEYGFDIVLSPTGYYLDGRRFQLAEIRLLISAVQTAPFVPREKSDALVKKLGAMLSRYQERDILKQTAIGAVKYDNDEVYRNIETLNLMIATRRQITFYYYKRGANRKDVPQRRGERYRVSPYALIWLQDRYYLVANMDGRDDLTHFRLDRMRAVKPDVKAWRHFSEVSEYISFFNASDYAAKCVNMFGGEVGTVKLRCSESLVSELIDRFGDDAAISYDNDGNLTATLRVAQSAGFLAWVSQFGDGMEILSPAPLREEMKERLIRAASLYS